VLLKCKIAIPSEKGKKGEMRRTRKEGKGQGRKEGKGQAK
jgi:hypothetical protein